MNSLIRRNPINTPILLDPSFLRAHGSEETEKALRRIVCSVKFELMEPANAVRLLGPEMSYHLVDPYLPGALKKFEPDMTLADVLSYTSSTRHFDLYFEDCWTGYFIAKRFAEQCRPDSLVLIHLDDHADMMPTLLCRSGDTLIDPTTGAMFDPASSSDWEAAIYSGAVNIGNFITPFYYSGSNIHVRHINNSTKCDELRHVSRESVRYELIPGKPFAAIRKSEFLSTGKCGNLSSGIEPRDGAERRSKSLDARPYRSRLFHQRLQWRLSRRELHPGPDAAHGGPTEDESILPLAG